MNTASLPKIIIVFAQEEEREKLELHVRKCVAAPIPSAFPAQVSFTASETIQKRPDASWLPSGTVAPAAIVFSCSASSRIRGEMRGHVSTRLEAHGHQVLWSDRPKQDLTRIDTVLRDTGLHIDKRLAQMLDVHRQTQISGEHRIQEWKNNFRRARAEGIGEFVLSTIDVFSPQQLVEGLRLKDLASLAGDVCVLKQQGSDLFISDLFRQHTGKASLPTLAGTLSQAAARSVLLLVDYVHSGSQLIQQLELLAPQQQLVILTVRPFQATRTGMNRVAEYMKNRHDSLQITWDLDTAKVIENLSAPEGLVTELVMKLEAYRHSPAQIQKVLTACDRLGKELRAYDSESSMQWQNGLGHAGLGLTSFAINSISKSVLPVLRLGTDCDGRGDCLVGDGTQKKFFSWIALMYHQNSSGTG